MLIIRGMIGSLFQIGMWAALLLIPAGTWHWPRAIQFIVGYGIIIEILTVILAVKAPESLKARLHPPVAKSQPKTDKIVFTLLMLSIFAFMIFIPLDVFRFKIFAPTSLAVSIFGAVIFLIGLGIVTAAIWQNSFAMPIVKDQKDRGQVLVDKGLYGIVRHPFYLGNIPFLVGLGLWLESYASLFMLVIVIAFFVARIFVEEKYLLKTLPGYEKYMKKVKYRLIPFVW